jgi:hypothetical protein
MCVALAPKENGALHLSAKARFLSPRFDSLRKKRAFLTRPEKKNLRCKEITLAGFS